MNKGCPLTIAHRGASYIAPENTIASFELAWQMGADGIEADFHLTGDGGIVCMHDASTGRTAGTDYALIDIDISVVQELDVGSWKGEKWAGEKAPSIEQVLEIVPAGKKIFIEIKSGPETVEVLKEKLSASALGAEQKAVISFNEEVVREAKRQISDAKVYLLKYFDWDDVLGLWVPSLEEIIEALERTGADGLNCSARDAVNDELVKAVRDMGKELHVWTIDDEEAAKRFVDFGVDSITSNRPDMLVNCLEELK